MNNKQRKARVKLLEDLVNAQAELIVIHQETLDAIDLADNAFATTVDPYNESVIGKDLQEIREQHMDREDELLDEISGYFDRLEGKDQKKPDDTENSDI